MTAIEILIAALGALVALLWGFIVATRPNTPVEPTKPVQKPSDVPTLPKDPSHELSNIKIDAARDDDQRARLKLQLAKLRAKHGIDPRKPD